MSFSNMQRGFGGGEPAPVGHNSEPVEQTQIDDLVHTFLRIRSARLRKAVIGAVRAMETAEREES